MYLLFGVTWSAFFLVIKQTVLRGSLTIYLHAGEKWNSWGIHSAFFNFVFDPMASRNGYI